MIDGRYVPSSRKAAAKEECKPGRAGQLGGKAELLQHSLLGSVVRHYIELCK